MWPNAWQENCCGLSEKYVRVASTPLRSTNMAIENGPFTVDIPPKKVVIFHSYVSLPEGVDNRGIMWM